MENIDSAPELIEDLKTLLPDKSGITLYFAPLNQVRCSSDALEIWDRITALEPMINDAGFVPKKHLNPIRQFRVFRCMADNPSSSVVIQPDGSLVPCLQSDPGSAFGNVREGITKKDIYDRYSAVGPVREQCRNCVFLPDCTPFPYCMVIDAQCCEQRMKTMTEYFKELVSEADRLGVPVEEGINPEELDVKDKTKQIIE